MKFYLFVLPSVLTCSFLVACQGQKQFGVDELSLEKTISFPGVKGRIDHLDVDPRSETVFMSALGNNTVEVFSIASGKIIRSIGGLSEPQGVGFMLQTGEIIVANGGNGKCTFYDPAGNEPTAVLDLGSDADDIRYDSVDKKIYVGYGRGGIAVIDPTNHEKVADISLPAHPEGFQVDKALQKLFVNVPDASQIDVIDLFSDKVIARWKADYGANFPMAIDSKNHIIFIGYRHPAKLVAMDGKNGNIISSTDLVADADDLYFDNQSAKIYASGGGGFIGIYRFKNSVITQVSNIATRTGARTSLLIPGLRRFVLAERAAAGKQAQVQVYKTRE